MPTDDQSNDAASRTDQPFSRLEPDPVVEQLVPNPIAPPNLVSLTGVLGRSDQDGVHRLYLTRQLNAYVEFEQSAVVHSTAIGEPESGFRATTVWLKTGTPLQLTRITTRQVQADFLSGGLTDAFLPTARALDMVDEFALAVNKRVGSLHGDECFTNNPHVPACTWASIKFGCDV
jgi:hypothetical protein